MIKIKNPVNMTIQQLKNELAAHGVELPTGRVLKATYVDLYNTHVFNRNHGFSIDDQDSNQKQIKTIHKKNRSSRTGSEENENNEPSLHALKNLQVKLESIVMTSDDEKSMTKNMGSVATASEASRKSKKEQFIKSNKTSKVKVNQEIKENKLESLENLTNYEIGARLKSLGQTVGPVTSTTRKVYLKKLTSLLESGDALMNGDKEAEEDEEQVIIHEEFPEDSNSAAKIIKRRRVQLSRHLNPTVTIDQSWISPNKIDTILKAQESHEPEKSITKQQTKEVTEQNSSTDSITSPASKSKPARSERRWIPIWLQVLFTIVIVFFTYLVFQAMERNPSPPLWLPRGTK